ncbi:MAG: DUF2924 domain-containing protein [Rhodospirillaceae bacterium]
MTTSVLAQIAALATAPPDALKAKWRELFNSEPPPYNRRFLESRLAYRLQELAHGGLGPDTEARLEALADEKKLADREQMHLNAKKDQLLPGTRLVRDWQGVQHEVTVLADGFEYRGRRFKSLSVIARTITGTRWSGPLFFGMRKGAGK